MASFSPAPWPPTPSELSSSLIGLIGPRGDGTGSLIILLFSKPPVKASSPLGFEDSAALSPVLLALPLPTPYEAEAAAAAAVETARAPISRTSDKEPPVFEGGSNVDGGVSPPPPAVIASLPVPLEAATSNGGRGGNDEVGTVDNGIPDGRPPLPLDMRPNCRSSTAS